MLFDYKKKIFYIISLIIIIVLSSIIVSKLINGEEEVIVETSVKTLTDKKTPEQILEEENDRDNNVQPYKPYAEQPEEEIEEDIEIGENDDKRGEIIIEESDEEIDNSSMAEVGDVVEVIKEYKKKEEKEYSYEDLLLELGNINERRTMRNEGKTPLNVDWFEIRNRIKKGMVLIYVGDGFEENDLRKWSSLNDEDLYVLMVSHGNSFQELKEMNLDIEVLKSDMNLIAVPPKYKENYVVFFLNKDGYIIDTHNKFDENNFKMNMDKIAKFYEENEEEWEIIKEWKEKKKNLEIKQEEDSENSIENES